MYGFDGCYISCLHENKFFRNKKIRRKIMGIIDLIMGWGVMDDETPIAEVEFEALEKADKKAKKN